VYESATGVGIVFRGVGGELWNISRSDNAPTNLTATTQATPAAGHPTSFVVNQQPHIVYRGTDRLIYDIWSDGTSWRVTQVCTEFAAADPVAAVDGTTGMVAVRMTNGIVYVAQLVDATWTCGPTVNAS
jgi:hypothetical protein